MNQKLTITIFFIAIITSQTIIYGTLATPIKHSTETSNNNNNNNSSTKTPDVAPKPISAPKYIPTKTESNKSPQDKPTENKKNDSNTIQFPKQENIIKNNAKTITSVSIKNNALKDATLTEIELLLAGKTTPFVENNLKIKIPAAKKNSRESITVFDITTESSIENFNGIKSITIDNQKLTFDNPKLGSNTQNPIIITQNNNTWTLSK